MITHTDLQVYRKPAK